MKNILQALSRGAVLATCAASAIAHDGHGVDGPHWHAADTLGFVTVIALATIALWLSRD